ncbi:deoxyribodipyrimidine photo-lyase [Nocardia sp. SYP-A9097]|uniref:cryptochrome/photolyase family protein n=1 Tax=Nocardia sp. SYP-A9097 TaxID=2663237 RepID=UPI00129B84F4|nr:deoxyribodipyrimidine photo-lyase [Nocardia sp. SYP-A9097]MRH87593.1 deoxyribodipyrimidine photo-lyase [Nocardia sp. SYP-A9097]
MIHTAALVGSGRVTVAVFTRDLRVHDNPVLCAAARASAQVVPLFVLDDAILGREPVLPNRIGFLLAALSELDAELRARGARLIMRRGEVVTEVERVATEVGAGGVHIAADVSRYSAQRARCLRERLAAQGIPLYEHASVTAVPPGELRPSSGGAHFAVFTPYFRRWLETPIRTVHPAPDSLSVPDLDPGRLPTVAELSVAPGSPQLSVGGETSARELLRAWLSGPVEQYAERADDLAADATSGLSPYLHFGCLSAAELVHRTDLSEPGGYAFARQLAWRDFQHQMLAARTELAWTDYRPPPAPPRDDPHAADAWRAGRTGFPVIDAAMRQLLAQGWMPGRARLIAASFLTKTLRVDWRIGAAHFLRWLVDADLANNQLNWQWAAGTGTDTRPNRTLNPILQAERHDPDGSYVHRWLPELADLPGGAVHRPWRAPTLARDYPPPIVEVNGM